MTIQYIIMFEFTVLSTIGLLYHYYEKKFLHLSTGASLRDYILRKRGATYKAVFAILTTCFALTNAHQGGYVLSLAEVGGALALGYGFDNALNKAHDEV